MDISIESSEFNSGETECDSVEMRELLEEEEVHHYGFAPSRNERIFNGLEIERQLELRRVANQILNYSMQYMMMEKASQKEDNELLSKASFDAFGICNKGVYPLGENGEPGVHDDLLRLFLCPEYCSRPLHDGLLARQFMLKHSRELKALCKGDFMIGKALAAGQCKLIEQQMQELPVSSQQLLTSWSENYLWKFENWITLSKVYNEWGINHLV